VGEVQFVNITKIGQGVGSAEEVHSVNMGRENLDVKLVREVKYANTRE
jgi:hypothetical protein